jgi:hypothetical protein
MSSAFTSASVPSGTYAYASSNAPFGDPLPTGSRRP